MKQAIRQMLTGRDNLTVDAFRVLAIVAVIVGLVLECAVVFFKLAGQTFSLQEYGIGFGALLLAAGGALKLKADTEPSDSMSITTKTETNVTETSK
jgi:protein-S-isoprenylcysteine O-methyltransferase Ste14